jgi:hypothetical protein
MSMTNCSTTWKSNRLHAIYVVLYVGMDHVLQDVLKQIDNLLRHPHGLLQQCLHLITLKKHKNRRVLCDIQKLNEN